MEGEYGVNMTEFEICQEFRQSKEPRKQIGILADLNVCSKREIAEILIRNGCEGVLKYYVNTMAAQNEKAPGAPPEGIGKESGHPKQTSRAFAEGEDEHRNE